MGYIVSAKLQMRVRLEKFTEQVFVIVAGGLFLY